MPLDPQVQALLEQMKQMGFVYTPALTVEQARAMTQMMIAARGTPEPVADVEDRQIPGPAGTIPIRIYTPQGNAPFPVLVFFHTGGWQLGNLDSQDPLCRNLANVTGCIVVSVDIVWPPNIPSRPDCRIAMPRRGGLLLTPQNSTATPRVSPSSAIVLEPTSRQSSPSWHATRAASE